MLFELIFQQIPFAHMEDDTAFGYQMFSKFLMQSIPSIIQGVDSQLLSADASVAPLIQLMSSCWNENPLSRPTFSQIFRDLNALTRNGIPSTISKMGRVTAVISPTNVVESPIAILPEPGPDPSPRTPIYVKVSPFSFKPPAAVAPVI